MKKKKKDNKGIVVYLLVLFFLLILCTMAFSLHDESTGSNFQEANEINIMFVLAGPLSLVAIAIVLGIKRHISARDKPLYEIAANPDPEKRVAGLQAYYNENRERVREFIYYNLLSAAYYNNGDLENAMKCNEQFLKTAKNKKLNRMVFLHNKIMYTLSSEAIDDLEKLSDELESLLGSMGNYNKAVHGTLIAARCLLALRDDELNTVKHYLEQYRARAYGVDYLADKVVDLAEAQYCHLTGETSKAVELIAAVKESCLGQSKSLYHMALRVETTVAGTSGSQ